MSRDYRKLKVFEMANGLVRRVYEILFPPDERFGLQTQLRRAAVSAATNIVEGTARKTNRDYSHFLRMALASATEVRYLVELSADLRFLPETEAHQIAEEYGNLIRALEGLMRAIQVESSKLKTED